MKRIPLYFLITGIFLLILQQWLPSQLVETTSTLVFAVLLGVLPLLYGLYLYKTDEEIEGNDPGIAIVITNTILFCAGAFTAIMAEYQHWLATVITYLPLQYILTGILWSYYFWSRERSNKREREILRIMVALEIHGSNPNKRVLIQKGKTLSVQEFTTKLDSDKRFGRRYLKFRRQGLGLCLTQVHDDVLLIH